MTKGGHWTDRWYMVHSPPQMTRTTSVWPPPPFIGYLLKGGLAILFSGKRWFEKIIQKYARLSFRGKSVSSLANLKFALVHAHISKMGST